MQGTSLTKQERECKLYDEFDKFTYKKGESLHEYYLRFTLLLNDMNIYKMLLEQFQVNTKFLNTLPAEWIKFVTDVKLVKDLHTTNVDQIHAHLEQHERHANEVRLMHERSSDHLALVTPSDDTVFSSKTVENRIDAINYVIVILTAVVTSHYPTTNNQLRNSSNLRQQATINDGRVTVQPVHGRQISYVVGEGHMSKQCTKPRRKRDDLWFKEKVLLVQAQASGQILHEEELSFLVDPGIPEAQATQMHNHDNVNNNMINQAVQVMPSSEQLNVVNHSETEITSDSNIIPYSQYAIESQQAAINLENKSVNDTLNAELERYKEQVKVLNEEQNVTLTSNDNISDSCAQSVEIDRLKQTLSEHLKEKESLMQTVSLLKDDFKKEESRNIDREIALEKRIKQLDNIKAQQLEPKLYVGDIIEKTNPIVILDSEETLMLAEESRSKMLLKQKDPMMLEKKVNTTPNSVNSPDSILSSRSTVVEVPKELPKVSMVNTSLKKLKHHLAGFDVVVKERTTPTAITEGS
ncbi:hypothetical protein Tco_0605874 [Tanacetum coccineum]